MLILVCGTALPAQAARRHIQTENILVAPYPEGKAAVVESIHKVEKAPKDPEGTSDPFEFINRPIWRFNYDTVDHYIYRPTTVAYMDVTSKEFRNGIQNFINNFREPRNTINNLLTFRLNPALRSFSRFVGNTVVGVFGFVDVMGNLGIEYQNKDFDMVLADYSVPHGPFLMLPFYGPTTVRDFTGIVVDSFQYPFSQFSNFELLVYWGIDSLYKREQLIAQEPLIDNAFDDYIFVREVFMQFQENRVAPLSPAAKPAEDEALEDFLDELD